MVEKGHKVWWICDITRGEIENPDLQIEGWVKPQEVSSFDMVMGNYTTLLRMYPLFLHCLCCEVEVVILSPFSLEAEHEPPP